MAKVSFTTLKLKVDDSTKKITIGDKEIEVKQYLNADEKYDLKYIIDTTQSKNKNWKLALSDTIYLNDKINFYDDSDAIVFVHFDKANAKAVLVNVSKNFDENNLKYDYFRTNECQFILKAWFQMKMDKINNDTEIKIKLDIKSVTLAETGITILSGSKLRLYEIAEI